MTNNFLFYALKFFIFYLVLFFLGRGLYIIFSKKDFLTHQNHSVFGLKLDIFYPLIGIFFIGNYLIFLNFFLPLNSIFSYFCFFPVFANLYHLPKLNSFKNIIFYPIFLIPSYDITYNYDAGLYHLGFQRILRESNIILGTSNIYGPYGVSSIYDYISSILWFDKEFIYFQFLNVIFIILFYEFLYENIKQKKYKILTNATISILIFSIFDNFGFGGGRNGFIYFQGIGKQDVAVAILFLITSLFIYTTLTSKNASYMEFLLITILTIFMIQLKISSFPILFFYSLLLYKMFYEGKLKNNFLRPIFLIIFTSSVWIVKTVLQTGCIIYPLTQTCFEKLQWTSIEYINITRESAIQFSKFYSFDYSFIIWFNDFIDYDLNRSIIFNFLISYIIIRLLFFRKNSETNNRKSLFFIFCSASLIFYLYFGPDSRYLIGLQLLLIASIGLFNKFKFRLNHLFLLSLIFISVLSMIRLNSYLSFNLMSSPSYEIPIPNVLQFENRFIPEEGDQCWTVKNCSPSRFSYKIVESGIFKIIKLDI